jgi:hypothetical protein
MIRCLITSTPPSEAAAGPGRRSARAVLTDSVLAAEASDLAVVSRPAEADIIFFAETHADDSEDDDAVLRVLRSSEWAEYRTKVVVHSGKDVPRPLVPGFYPSLPQGWAKFGLSCLGAPYLAEPNPFLEADVGWSGKVERLASFIGSCGGKPVRQQLLSLASRPDSSTISVRDSSAEFVGTLRRNDPEGHNLLKKLFVRDILEARFALCPSGAGASSFRIFEAMQLSRAPVIIADDWLRPLGPDWDSFAIFVREKDLAQLPQILGKHSPEWEARGQRARSAWEAFYGPKTLGPTLIRQGAQLLASRGSERLRSRLAQAYVAGPRRVAMVSTRLRNKIRSMM